jgi:protein MpaA
MNFFRRQASAAELIVAFVVAAAAIVLGWLALTVMAIPAAEAQTDATQNPKLGAVATIVVTFTPGPTSAAGNTIVIPTATANWTQTATPSSTPTPTATLVPFDPSAHHFTIGKSVGGRDIVGVGFPASQAPAQGLVLVNGIHGDEMNSAPVVSQLVADVEGGAVTLPPALTLYVIESLNPDGNAADERLNANNVDLNRNWEAYDWQSGVEIAPYVFLPQGGGREPFSEPETQAMRDWLLALQAEYPTGLTVIYFHSAYPPKGLIMPGAHRVNGRDLGDSASREVGVVMSEATGYGYSNFWPGGYTVSGDASTWAVAHLMRSLTVELPVRGALDATQAQKLREGILAVISFLGNQ